MARPTKYRVVARRPRVALFRPHGESRRPPVILKLEEYEALRLHDTLGLEEVRAALRMRVSRSTFHRVLVSAQRKVSGALVFGQAIKIEGGNYRIK